MQKTKLSTIPAAVAAELTKFGARINQSECVEFQGYWAVDFVLGHRYRISYSDCELLIERPGPTMRSGHEADWYTVSKKSAVSENAVSAEAVALLSSVK